MCILVTLRISKSSAGGYTWTSTPWVVVVRHLGCVAFAVLHKKKHSLTKWATLDSAESATVAAGRAAAGAAAAADACIHDDILCTSCSLTSWRDEGCALIGMHQPHWLATSCTPSMLIDHHAQVSSWQFACDGYMPALDEICSCAGGLMNVSWCVSHGMLHIVLSHRIMAAAAT